MQNAMDIMAMVQKANLAKPKTDVPSKPLGMQKTSFKKELLEARKELPRNDERSSKAADASLSRTTEKKVQKLAAVMANNNAKADVKQEDAVADVKQQEPTAVETKDTVDQAVSNAAAQTVDEVSKPEEQVKLDETMNSVLEMLQQLLQQMKNPTTADNADSKTEEPIAILQGASQKLEQLLVGNKVNPSEELGKLLKIMQTELTKLMEQLQSTGTQKTFAPQLEQMLQQTMDTLKVQVAQVKQMLQQTAMPKLLNIVQNEMAAGETATDVSDLETAKVPDSKPAAVTTAVKGEDVPAEEQQPVITNTPKSDDSKEAKQEDSKKQTDNNTAVQEKPKQAAAADKPADDSFKNIAALQSEKPNFQINIKAMNTVAPKQNLVNISKADIVNQIVKKADIILREGHQEIIMKLEPESLGKLNLKVIMENGQITAKFVAESQQVKEVIESSFNQLKDALQEKGVNVQSFSVTVGQDSSGFQSKQGFDQWKRLIKLNSKLSKDYLNLDDEMITNNNPYSYHDGKVDYRA